MLGLLPSKALPVILALLASSLIGLHGGEQLKINGSLLCCCKGKFCNSRHECSYLSPWRMPCTGNGTRERGETWLFWVSAKGKKKNHTVACNKSALALQLKVWLSGAGACFPLCVCGVWEWHFLLCLSSRNGIFHIIFTRQYAPLQYSLTRERRMALICLGKKMRFLQMKHPIPEAVKPVINERQLISKKSSVP